MQTKYLIFDFDGVLADTLDVCAHVRVALGIAKDYTEGISIGEQYFNNPVDHTKNHTMTPEQMQARTDRLISR
jgi:beta-phosphoglucomutase-like phosphatase (HAD superfamily)